MTEAQKAYLDGASMAYKDCGHMIYQLVDNCPDELRDLMESIKPVGEAMMAKSSYVYEVVK